jgi:hypothetical protein
MMMGIFFFLFWQGDKSIFVKLSRAGAHGVYLARSCLWMASDFQTWQVLALCKTEVFSAQRKIPSLLIVTTVLSLQRVQAHRSYQTHLGGLRDAAE